MGANWTRFNKYLYKYWKLQAAVIILGVITIPLSLLNPYLAKLVIDKAYADKNLKLFFILAIIGGSIFIFNGLVNSFSTYLSKRINHSVHFDMTKDLFRHLQRLSLSFFNNKSTGEHIYRISSDVSSVSTFVCNTLPQIIQLFPRLLFILVIVFYLNWKLAIFVLFLFPISYIHPYFFRKWLKEATRRMIEKSQGIFKGLHEVFSHIHLVKALGREDYEIKRFEEGLSKKIEAELKNVRLSSISSFSSSVLNKTISGIIALYGGYQVIKGTMTLGSLTAVMIYLTQLTGLINSTAKFCETITVNSVSRRRLSEIMDIKPKIQDTLNAKEHHILQGRIEFKGVCFGYKKDKFVLKNLDFSIEPAAKIAIAGLSGCGKTTLLALILRLYEAEKGAILIDGIDIKNIKLESLKEHVGIALQESFLWNDTAANNILYGKVGGVKQEMSESAKLARAHNFILNLPKQYDSIIGEMACKISEGQKQRIAIARALIRRPKILMLDEAFSSLDSETEDKIMDNIKREFEDSTIIVVSHRLSTVKKMDLVYFLKNPSNLEIGTHEELLEKVPRYKELFSGQIAKIV